MRSDGIGRTSTRPEAAVSDRRRGAAGSLRILKNTLIYMAGAMANQAVALLVLPVLTRYLSPEEYGSVALFTALVGFAGPVVGMSMKTHIARNFFKTDKTRMADISWNALVGVSANLGVLVVVCFGMSLAFPSLSRSLTGLSIGWVAIALLVAWCQSVSGHLTTFLRVQGRPIPYAGFEFTFAALNLGLSLMFVIQLGWGWRGRSAGFALSAIGAAIVGALAMRQMGYASGRAEGGLMRHLYRICLPLVPHAFAGQITTMSSRLFLNGIAGKESVGLYAVGHSIGGLVNMPLDAFNNAWTPWVFKRLAARDSKSDQQIVRLTLLVSAGLISLWALMAAGAPFALRMLTNPRYHGAAEFVGWVAFGYVLQGIYGLLTPILIDEGKTDALALISMAVAVLSLGLNWLLIHFAGAIGAAYTLVACAGFRLLFVFGYAQRIRPMPWFDSFGRGARSRT